MTPEARARDDKANDWATSWALRLRIEIAQRGVLESELSEILGFERDELSHQLNNPSLLEVASVYAVLLWSGKTPSEMFADIDESVVA